MGYKVKKIYQGTNLVRPAGWTPGSNTLLYLPMKTDLLDHSGNNISVTNTGMTIENGVGKITSNGQYLYTNGLNYVAGNNTQSVRINTVRNDAYFQCFYGINNAVAYVANSYGDTKIVPYGIGLYCSADGITNFVLQNNKRYNVVLVSSTMTSYLYVNGDLVSSVNYVNSSGTQAAIGTKLNKTDNMRSGLLSEYILENKARTAQEVSDYYNNTKSKYGL